MRRPGWRGAKILGTICLVVLAAASLSMSTHGEDVQALESQRVTATPIPTPSPTPAPTPRELDWTPRSNAGPWATDGTVHLPTLQVSAPVVGVGVNQSNEMVIPRNAHEVAWLDQGGFPGPLQNGLLAGHVRWGGRAGSFNRLGELNSGDPVVVTFGSNTWTFEVTWVRAYDRNTPEAPELMGWTDVPSVTLVTCGGTFDRAAGTHTHRIIARAELVSTV